MNNHSILLVVVVAALSWSADAFHAAPLNRGGRQVTSRLHAEPQSSRRDLLVATASAVLGGFVTGYPAPALAKYGDSSSMELPSYIDFLIERNSKPGTDQILYKGADPGVLLLRLKDAGIRLEEIPALADQKKWSQIQGILSGPLGTLSQTLTFIATPESPAKVKDAAKKLKTEVFAIGAAASSKNGPACTAKSQQAVQYLDDFVRVAFQ